MKWRSSTKRIYYAIEKNLAVKLTLWKDGFTRELTGRIHQVDPFKQEIIFEIKLGEGKRINVKGVVGMAILD
jgi:hypothetical protein